MEFPVRCFSCGAVIGHLYETYQEQIKEKEPKQVLDELGVKRYCCRKIFISHVHLIDTLLKYKYSV